MNTTVIYNELDTIEDKIVALAIEIRETYYAHEQYFANRRNLGYLDNPLWSCGTQGELSFGYLVKVGAEPESNGWSKSIFDESIKDTIDYYKRAAKDAERAGYGGFNPGCPMATIWTKSIAILMQVRKIKDLI